MATEWINLDEGLGRVRNNKKLFKRMLSMFLASEEFSALEDALAAGDLEKAAASAHSIKGMTGNLSLTPLFLASTELLEPLRAGKLDEGALAKFRTAHDETKKAVEEMIPQL